MKKTTAILAAFIAVLSLQSFAQDEAMVFSAPVNYGPNLYLSAKIGGFDGALKLDNYSDYEFDTLFGGAVALGFRLSNNLKLELEFFAASGDVSEYQYEGYAFNDIEVTVVGAGAQLLFNAPLTPSLWFYAGAGAGFLNCELSTPSAYGYDVYYLGFGQYYYDYQEYRDKEDANYFYLNGTVGLELFIADNLSLDLSGRYFGTNSKKFGGASSVSLNMYGIFAGVTLSF